MGEELKIGADIVNKKAHEVEVSDDVKKKIEDGKLWIIKSWEVISEWGSWVAEKLHLAFFAEILCSKLHDHVDHFHPSDLELGSQNL